ncbi:MAG: redoxin family protein [Rickettsiaceae bacterium H1]|nr:redoxin family protein [Rickettsiaceae bacterium H1]
MKINNLVAFVFLVLSSILVLALILHDNKKSVEIYLPSLFSQQSSYLNSKNLVGKPYVLNVFNSWCTSCLAEHNLWFSIKDKVDLYGISYIDNAIQAQKFLKDHGNPYVNTGFDKRGISQESLGIQGLPETFVIDKLGVIRLHIIGPITEEKINNEILPLYNALLTE